MKTRRFGRLAVALLLSAAMLIGLVPTALAAEGETEAVTQDVVGEPTLGVDNASSFENARSNAASPLTVSNLEISLGKLAVGSPLPGISLISATSDEVKVDFPTTATNKVVWTGQKPDASPTEAGRYGATITIQCDEGYVFDNSILKGVSVVAGVVLKEGTGEIDSDNSDLIPANPNNFSVSFPDPLDKTTIKISCTFTILEEITELNVYVPAPIIGQSPSTWSAPGQVIVKTPTKTLNEKVSTLLTWRYKAIRTVTSIDKDGFALKVDEEGNLLEDKVNVGNTISMPQSGVLESQTFNGEKSTDNTENEEGPYSRTTTAYRYYPILRMGPPDGYKFSKKVKVSFQVASEGQEIKVQVDWIGTDGQIEVHPYNPDSLPKYDASSDKTDEYKSIFDFDEENGK